MRFRLTKVAMALRTPARNFSLAQKRVGVTSKRRQCSCRTCQTVYCRARRIGVRLIMLSASTESDIDTVFTSLVQQGGGALLVAADPLLVSRRDQLVALVTRHAVPTIFPQREL